MAEKIFEIKNEFYRLERGLPLVLYKPVEKNPREKIAILALHGADFLSFEPMVELAKHGYVAAGANPVSRGDPRGRMLDVKNAMDFVRSYPGVEKVIIIGHSGGGCLMSEYQYIAENGIGRMKNQKRVIPFPEIEPLTPADGCLFLDCNYTIMSALSFDPAVKSLTNGIDRDPELDIYNPENGYDPAGSHYSKEFIKKFQKKQVEFYYKVYDYALERYELIKAGKGAYKDDEFLQIPGAMSMNFSNKLFMEDISLFSHTRNEQPLLHPNGEITKEIVYTNRLPRTSLCSDRIASARNTTVVDFLRGEFKFDNFGYDESSIWGCDWSFIPESTFANMEGIRVPCLFEGNTAGHEFLAAEYNYEHSAAEDKSIVFTDGALHGFFPVNESYGDTIRTLGNYTAQWIAERFR